MAHYPLGKWIPSPDFADSPFEFEVRGRELWMRAPGSPWMSTGTDPVGQRSALAKLKELGFQKAEEA